MYLFDSADGVKFGKVQEEPVFTTRLPNGFDGIQSIFWSEAEDSYLLYFRYMTANDGTGKRSVARSTSRDLMSWTDPVPMEYSTGVSFRPSICMNIKRFLFPGPPHLCGVPASIHEGPKSAGAGHSHKVGFCAGFYDPLGSELADQ